MVGEYGGLGAVALHSHAQLAAVRAHAHLRARALAEAPRARELQLDVLQLDVVHAVDDISC